MISAVRVTASELFCTSKSKFDTRIAETGESEAVYPPREKRTSSK